MITETDKNTIEADKITTNSAKAWLLAARPKTLSGAAVPVAIGLALAYSDAQQYGDDAFSWTAAALCLLFAMLMQIDANFVNDLFDYARGNDDTATRLGPLRACTQGWVTPDAMKRAIASLTVAACAVGLPLVFYGGMEMIVIGMLCVVGCFLYTTHLSYKGLGDVMVLLFFGIVPVGFTYYVQLHTCTALVMAAATACGLVIDALLMVNNYRDRDNDRRDGKRTLVVIMGQQRAELMYLSLGIAATAIDAAFWAYGHMLAFLLPLIYLMLHIGTFSKMRRISQGRQLNECLAETSRNILVYGVCIVAGVLLT